MELNRNLCGLPLKRSELNAAVHSRRFMPECVSNCTFSLQLLRVALSAIEKCELSFFGLQCTFASAAARGKTAKNNDIQGLGSATESTQTSADTLSPLLRQR